MPDDDLEIVHAFQKKISSIDNVVIKQRSYGGHITIFEIQGLTGKQAIELSHFPGIASIGTFPSYCLLAPSSKQVEPAKPDNYPPPAPNKEYPVVGLIDSGVNPKHRILSNWIDGTETNFIFIDPSCNG